MHSDVLIVGAGSAGSVLAERLSVDERCRVTVVEAGPGPADTRAYGQIADGLRLPIGPASPVVRRYTSVLTEAPKRYSQIMRGAVVGGSGAVNGGYFCRALPADIDGWGISGWSWADVLPHFKGIECDVDFGGEIHGSSGPITVRRVPEFCSTTAAFIEAARAAGFGWIADLNGSTPEAPMSPGVGALPLNIDGGNRAGPGSAFLVPAMGRRNLTVLTGTRAARIRFVDGRAAAVDCSGPQGRTILSGDRIILCAGAIGSAHLLMLSGIGPQSVLHAAGVAVEVDLPVGADTVDHPELLLPVSWSPAGGHPPLEAVLVTGDGLEIRPYTAGFRAMTGEGSGARTDPLHLGVALMRPRSRGRVRVVSPNPDVAPVIEHRYDSVPADVGQLRSGIEMVSEIVGGQSQSEMVWSTSQHLCGSARMGAEGDPAAVVDPRCRVLGVDGLWVVDGSILPRITSRGPHATIVMMGHRAAGFITAASNAPAGV